MAICFECGSPANHNHHVIPKQLGGTKTVPLCNFCHPKAHGKDGYWPIGELVKKIHQKKKENGEWLGSRIPFGYKVHNKRLVPLPKEQDVVKQIIARKLMGFSQKAITNWLNDNKVPTKMGTGRWHGKMVARLCKWQKRKKDGRARVGF